MPHSRRSLERPNEGEQAGHGCRGVYQSNHHGSATDNHAQLADNHAQLADDDAQLTNDDAQLTNDDAQLADDDAQLADNHAQLADGHLPLADNAARADNAPVTSNHSEKEVNTVRFVGEYTSSSRKAFIGYEQLTPAAKRNATLIGHIVHNRPLVITLLFLAAMGTVIFAGDHPQFPAIWETISELLKLVLGS